MLEAFRISGMRAEQELFSNLTFSFSSGQWGWVKGGNGQGKSTLLKLLAGLLPKPKEASIRWQGKEIERFSSCYLKNLLYVGHSAPLHPLLTPTENLTWLASLQEMGLFLPLSERIHQALCAMEVSHHDTPCEQLSFGQRQRVSLARLYLSLGKLWLLDEPCTGLDDRGQMLLEKCLQEHFSRGGVAVVASHTKFYTLPAPKFIFVLNEGDCTVTAGGET